MVSSSNSNYNLNNHDHDNARQPIPSPVATRNGPFRCCLPEARMSSTSSTPDRQHSATPDPRDVHTARSCNADYSGTTNPVALGTRREGIDVRAP